MSQTDLADIKVEFTDFIALQKETLLPHVQTLQEQMNCWQRGQVFKSEGREVIYGIFGGQSMNIPSLKKKEWISVGSTEMTPLEQRCKDRHYSEVQTLKTSEFSFHCLLFPAAWLRYNFLS